ncbi:arsenical resistance protein ArsH [Commensalibacter oyaizuii]|uniref:Arsenical resistance protein ArsH n=1 Tax=Commensalibacter oyaizuii TaxID=3043873 RepID=A0ABT6Q077_9PROT|nr:arsenical resistance protein ArsH [Commensalibacter sp. TBRC 16381]MDI2090512.1 arsenical resistance protein ArsH [Commensalibacter sp. TBRC 16381]
MSRVLTLSNPTVLPALNIEIARQSSVFDLIKQTETPIKILLLYGSLRARSYSRLAIEEAARILQFFGAQTRIFNPTDLPMPDQVPNDDHPAVHELRELALWADGHVWCSPERHGQISSIMKAQIDHLPLQIAGIRPTQGRTLAVMQVSGGSQSFNSVNNLRILGRWMRMFTIPNQSSIAKAFQEFDEEGRMKPSAYYDRIVDVMEELIKITILLRPHQAMLINRYSECKEAGKIVDPKTDLPSIAIKPQ